ncbi:MULTISPECIES: XdhC family protein [Metallosphaera]|uniref:XdhC family protein n=1 Tax=Metallosphaera TaxID=41980 RepID=UPI001F05A936|nr:XdhC family protein [Metallosphaera sedula]MCH1770233.1 XdhC family protein [Metallosphaera sedula]MCP6727933.1 XdhC family protein [Metallosphaera sedula]
MDVLIFSSSREAEMEEPVFCDRDTVKVDESKCKGKSLGVAPTVSRMLKMLGYKVVIVDPFAEDGDYEADQVIRGNTFQIPDELVKDKYVLVATKHVYDTWALMKAILGGAKEVAAVMSVRRAKVILKRLLQAGIPKEKLLSLRIPAGLDLNGEQENEIALSIVAEIVAVSRGGTGIPLRDKKGLAKVVEEL